MINLTIHQIDGIATVYIPTRHLRYVYTYPIPRPTPCPNGETRYVYGEIHANNDVFWVYDQDEMLTAIQEIQRHENYAT